MKSGDVTPSLPRLTEAEPASQVVTPQRRSLGITFALWDLRVQRAYDLT